MSKVKWSEILINNEEAIKEALEKAYRQACGSQAHSGWQECVVMDENGNISVYSIGQNSMSEAVWKGEAFEIARFNWFDPLDGIDSLDVISFLRNENKLEDWVKYLAAEDHIDELDENSDIENEANNATYYIYTIEIWNPELWKQYLSEVEDYQVQEFIDNDLDRYYDEAVKSAKENEYIEEY